MPGQHAVLPRGEHFAILAAVSEPAKRPTLSVAIITYNEEANIGRTLDSVKPIADEIVVVDSGSTDRTCDIARRYGVKVFVEEWKGFAAQKNLALDKCTGDWILSLDADEELSSDLALELPKAIGSWSASTRGALINRRNYFLGHWIRHGGFYPDPKPRLFQRGYGAVAKRAVHEDIEIKGDAAPLRGDLIHHAYPTLTSYIEHMNRYSSLGAETVVEKKRVGFSFLNIVMRPIATFVYNYIFRLGFLDGKEGLLLHLYHSAYVSWKYAKAWELSRTRQ